MAGRVVHDDTPDDDYIEVMVPSLELDDRTPLQKALPKTNDPFKRDIRKIRQLEGLSPAKKRQLTRDIKKSASIVADSLGEGPGNEKPLATGKDGAVSKARVDKFATGYGAFDVVEPDYNLDYLAKIYELNPTHMAAVDAKVTNIVGLGYSFNESLRTQDKISRTEGVEKLEKLRRRVQKGKVVLDEWLDSLNNEETFIETLRKVMTDLETTGNGYFEIGRIWNVSESSPLYGQIGYIGHIHSTTIRRRVQKDGYVQLVAGRATFFRNFGENAADPIGGNDKPNEIIHLSKYTPTNSYYGVPDILSARNAVAGEEFASRFNLDYFEHKAVPRYIVVIKNAKLSASAEQRLVDFLQTGLKGQNHRTVYVPLPADNDGKPVEFKLEPVEASITDASFVKYKDMNRDEILMSHRTPLPQVGYTANMSLGATRDSARMFAEQVCRPWQDIIERRLKPFFREKTDAYDFHLHEMTLTDEDTASRIHERYLRWEVNTPNEIREWLGKKGRDGGDKPVGVIEQIRVKATAGAKTSGENTPVQQANQSRTRDAERSGGPDTPGSDRTRQVQGEGRQTE